MPANPTILMLKANGFTCMDESGSACADNQHRY